jgi:alkyldihydroxyacetonephosphate synthase
MKPDHSKTPIAYMKLQGWGHPHVTFPMEDKPNLWPFIKNKLGIKKELYEAPLDTSKINLPPNKLPNPSQSVAVIEKIIGVGKASIDDFQRLIHAFGKSFPDLWKARQGIVNSAPDMIVWPESHEDVIQIVEWAKNNHVHIIAFGGGTNIVGALDVKSEAQKPVISMDMRRMNRVLEILPKSNLALIETGALGPSIESQLGEKGFSLGHFPDSFEFSTLGGWIATRSAGMQSDAYGRIEDMVMALHAVTDNSNLELKPFPATSAGPDLSQTFIGSEGCYGIMTRAWMRIHSIPEKKSYVGFLFRNFSSGINAVQACHKADIKPSLVRLQDEGETELAFQLKSPKPLFKELIETPIKKVIKTLGYTRPAIMVLGFEGTEKEVTHKSKTARNILIKHGGFPLGDSIGDAWSKDKYNTPYLRDYVMDYGGIADVAETSTTWEHLTELHSNVLDAIKMASDDEEVSHYSGCHLSHTYETGGCLYFTWAMLGGEKPLERYYRVKGKVTDEIVRSQGTLSHHHAVGTEHLPWLANEIGSGGVSLLSSLKKVLDPKNMFNPGGLDPKRQHPYLGNRP